MRTLEFIKSNHRSSIQLILISALAFCSQQIYDLNQTDMWWETDADGPIAMQYIYSGLWTSCINDGSGDSCEDVQVFWIDLPESLLFARYFILTAQYCSWVSLFCYFLGSNFTSLLAEENCSKLRLKQEKDLIQKEREMLKNKQREAEDYDAPMGTNNLSNNQNLIQKIKLTDAFIKEFESQKVKTFLYKNTTIKYNLIRLGVLLHFVSFASISITSVWICYNVAELYFIFRGLEGNGLDFIGHSYVWSASVYHSWRIIATLLGSLFSVCWLNDKDKEDDDDDAAKVEATAELTGSEQEFSFVKRDENQFAAGVMEDDPGMDYV